MTARPERQLDAKVAEAMGLTVAWYDLPHYSTNMSDAWIVVDYVTRIPQSLAEAERAANTRFGYWWERTPLWSYSEQEAATAICVAFLEAVSKGPL